MVPFEIVRENFNHLYQPQLLKIINKYQIKFENQYCLISMFLQSHRLIFEHCILIVIKNFKFHEICLNYLKYMNPFPKAVPNNSSLSEQEQLMELLKSNPELMQKYQQQLAKMKSQSKNNYQPLTSEQYLKSLPIIEKYLDPEGGLMIQPKPSFVFKFLQKRTNEKIFVNIVTHQVIDHPEEKLLVDFQNQPGLRIPMSMGRIREDHDKSGNICKVVDVVLNPTIVKTAQQNVDVLGFTAQIVGNYLLQKYKIAVTDDVVKKVKGVKYKGNKVEIQRVKGKKAPKIQQLSQENLQQQKRKQQKEQQVFDDLNEQTKKPNILRPQFQIFSFSIIDQKYEPFSLQASSFSHLKIMINLPHLIHSKGIHLQGSTQMLYLLVKNLYQLCLKLPFEVEQWKSTFSRKDRKLKIVAVKKRDKKVEVIPNLVQQKKQKDIKQVKINLESDLLYDLV